MSRQTAPAAALHPIACDCQTCDQRISVTRLADAGAAAFFIGIMLGLSYALATKPAATIADFLMLVGCAS